MSRRAEKQNIRSWHFPACCCNSERMIKCKDYKNTKASFIKMFLLGKGLYKLSSQPYFNTGSRTPGRSGLLWGLLPRPGSAMGSEVGTCPSAACNRENGAFLLIIVPPVWVDIAHALAGGARVSMHRLFFPSCVECGLASKGITRKPVG